MTWKCFKEEYPKPSCGIIVKIDDNEGEYDVKGHLFYGYVFNNSKYIYLILDITDFSKSEDAGQMGWKVLKDYNVENIYWYYYSEFSDAYRF